MDASLFAEQRALCHQVYRHGRTGAAAADRQAAERHVARRGVHGRGGNAAV